MRKTKPNLFTCGETCGVIRNLIRTCENPRERDFTRPDIGKSRSLSQVRAPPECAPCAARTLPDRLRLRSVIDCDHLRCDLTLADHARPPVQQQWRVQQQSRVSNQPLRRLASRCQRCQALKRSAQVTINPSESNSATDCPMPRRGWPEPCNCGALANFPNQSDSVARCDGHTDRDPWHDQLKCMMRDPPSAEIPPRRAI